jgi:tetratricopeptide (TPR) repeat protein
MVRARLLCASLLSAVCLMACSPSRPTLLAVSLPDLARVEASVRVQAERRFEFLTQQRKRSATTDAELAAAYGDLGMLLNAAEYKSAAEPCYLNAQRLAPGDKRWPYYLAQLYRSQGDTAKAEAAFQRVLQIQPDDFATLVWLGRLELDKGHPEEAEPLFTRAYGIMPRSIAVLAGLGGASLARQNYANAVKSLEEALTIDPEADSLHAPLGMAYRGLGQLDKAQPHLRQWRNREIPVPDALMQELALLLESGLSYELRGIRALEAKDWTSAAGYFRRGLTLATDNTAQRRSLQHKLGTALFMAGDAEGAARQFEEVVRASPTDGVDESSANSGRSHDAIDHLSAAVKYQPNYLEAELALGDVLRRTGRADASLASYKDVLALNPRASQARMGYAIALSALGRYREARDWLVDATTQAPDQPEFVHALARLLATAPDDRVRDGRRAKALVEQLLVKGPKTTSLGETVAMTFAELGDYEEAAATQRGVMAAADKAGLKDDVQRMMQNLRLYERRQPCRIPWRPDEVALISSLASPRAVSNPVPADSPRLR